MFMNGLVADFHYQSGGISLTDWVALFTLCLAPVVAHVASGIPHQVYLDHTRPRWHDFIIFYNPTTILWRYFAILDRRIRAKQWSPEEVAASNAVFWTLAGWTGSEELDVGSRFLIKSPSSGARRLLGWSSVQTALITGQGVSAAYALFCETLNPMDIRGTLGISALNNVFNPIAIFGLVRLAAAVWLTDDFSYADQPESSSSWVQIVRVQSHQEYEPSRQEEGRQLLVDRASWGLSIASGTTESKSTSRFKRLFNPLSVLTLLIYHLLLLILLLLAYVSVFPSPVSQQPYHTYSSFGGFFQGTFYTFFLAVTVAIYPLARLFGWDVRTTVIPCAGHWWYKVYTVLLVLWAVVVLVLSALETRLACGQATTYPSVISLNYNITVNVDKVICQGSRLD